MKKLLSYIQCPKEDLPLKWFLNKQLHRTEELFLILTQCPAIDLPIYLGLGFDEYIAERLQS